MNRSQSNSSPVAGAPSLSLHIPSSSPVHIVGQGHGGTTPSAYESDSDAPGLRSTDALLLPHPPNSPSTPLGSLNSPHAQSVIPSPTSPPSLSGRSCLGLLRVSRLGGLYARFNRRTDANRRWAQFVDYTTQTCPSLTSGIRRVAQSSSNLIHSCVQQIQGTDGREGLLSSLQSLSPSMVLVIIAVSMFLLVGVGMAGLALSKPIHTTTPTTSNTTAPPSTPPSGHHSGQTGHPEPPNQSIKGSDKTPPQSTSYKHGGKKSLHTDLSNNRTRKFGGVAYWGAASHVQPHHLPHWSSVPSLAPNNHALEFLVLGDWGVRSEFQTQVGDAAGDYIMNRLSPVVISTGDHFYPAGISSIHDPKIQLVFESRFKHPGLNKPWLLTLGNHDCEGNVPALLQYAKGLPKTRLTQPDRYYYTDFEIPSSESSTSSPTTPTTSLPPTAASPSPSSAQPSPLFPSSPSPVTPSLFITLSEDITSSSQPSAPSPSSSSSTSPSSSTSDSEIDPSMLTPEVLVHMPEDQRNRVIELYGHLIDPSRAGFTIEGAEALAATQSTITQPSSQPPSQSSTQQPSLSTQPITTSSKKVDTPEFNSVDSPTSVPTDTKIVPVVDIPTTTTTTTDPSPSSVSTPSSSLSSPSSPSPSALPILEYDENLSRLAAVDQAKTQRLLGEVDLLISDTEETTGKSEGKSEGKDEKGTSERQTSKGEGNHGKTVKTSKDDKATGLANDDPHVHAEEMLRDILSPMPVVDDKWLHSLTEGTEGDGIKREKGSGSTNNNQEEERKKKERTEEEMSKMLNDVNHLAKVDVDVLKTEDLSTLDDVQLEVVRKHVDQLHGVLGVTAEDHNQEHVTPMSTGSRERMTHLSNEEKGDVKGQLDQQIPVKGKDQGKPGGDTVHSLKTLSTSPHPLHPHTSSDTSIPSIAPISSTQQPSDKQDALVGDDPFEIETELPDTVHVLGPETASTVTKSDDEHTPVTTGTVTPSTSTATIPTPTPPIATSTISPSLSLPSSPASSSSPPSSSSSSRAFVRIISLDTCSLTCEDPNDAINHYERSQCERMSHSLTGIRRVDQLAWLREVLADSQRNSSVITNIIVAHSPLFTMGPHGSNLVLLGLLSDLLADSKTHLFLSGHDHTLQHIVLERDTKPSPSSASPSSSPSSSSSQSPSSEGEYFASSYYSIANTLASLGSSLTSSVTMALSSYFPSLVTPTETQTTSPPPALTPPSASSLSPPLSPLHVVVSGAAGKRPHRLDFTSVHPPLQLPLHTQRSLPSLPSALKPQPVPDPMATDIAHRLEQEADQILRQGGTRADANLIEQPIPLPTTTQSVPQSLLRPIYPPEAAQAVTHVPYWPYGPSVPAVRADFLGSVPGFASVQVSRDGLRIVYIDHKGRVLHVVRIPLNDSLIK